jgi:leucyl aminopeptidase
MIDLKLARPGRPADVLAVGCGPSRLLLDGISTELLPLAARAVLEAWGVQPGTGEARVLPMPGSVPSEIVVAGLGAGGTRELRLAGAAIARAAAGPSITVAVPAGGAGLAALVEGLALASYSYTIRSTARRSADSRSDHSRSAGVRSAASRAGQSRSEPSAGLRSAHVLATDGDEGALRRGQALAAAALWARDLTNTPAMTKTPGWLAAQAAQELGPLGVRVFERDETWLAERGFGGVLAVGGGSAAPPRLIEALWRGPGSASAPHLVVVGKGITFDTGGLNIKPGPAMRPMHTDMGGGAAALGALRAVATLGARVRVTVLVPAAQNSVSGSAMRPGDVIRHYGGRTSEVLNTDAEGRLVLADALAYAVARLRPSVLLDVATLTGAMKVALGLRTAGVFATSDHLVRALTLAAVAADEPIWRMPLQQDYSSLLSSEVADVNNAPGNPGAITAALFLRPFAGDVPWAHLDIAGPARSSTDADVVTNGATGFGTRLLAEWILASAG